MTSFEQVQVMGGRKKKKDELWLISYADLVTNLMAVFIMLLSMSTFDMQRFEAMSSKMSSDTSRRKNTLEELKRQVDAEIHKRNMQTRVQTNLDLAGLHVEFLSGVLFASASADLSSEAVAEARTILEILGKTEKKYILSFEGYTDDIPVKRNAQYRDNWDLSSARGASLLSKMKVLGVPEERMTVAGYAHTRPKVRIEGKTGTELEAARAANRRVVIRVFQQ